MKQLIYYQFSNGEEIIVTSRSHFFEAFLEPQMIVDLKLVFGEEAPTSIKDPRIAELKEKYKDQTDEPVEIYKETEEPITGHVKPAIAH